MTRSVVYGPTVTLDAGGNKWTNLADGVASSDAATVGQLSGAPSSSTAGRAFLATQVAASTISNSKYNAFAIMDQLPSGDLVTVYREGTSHASDAGVLKMRTSTDGGRTWSSTSTVVSEGGVDLRNIGGGVTPTGRIVVFYARYNFGGAAFLNQKFVYSDDGGATWSSPAAVSVGTDTTFSPTGNMIATNVGTLLQLWYGDDGTNYRLHVIASTDNGATWGSAVTVATSTTIRYTEASIAYLGGSYLVAVIRRDSGTTYYQFLSDDDGATWSSQGTTSFDSWTTPAPPCLISYATLTGKHEVACYYMNRDANKMRVVYSTAADLIAGTTGWSAYTELGTSSGTDSGYQAVIHPAGRAIGVGWFYNGTSGSVADMKFFVAVGPAGMENSAVTAGTYGDSTHVGQFTVDAAGLLTAASSVAISGGGGGGGLVTKIYDYTVTGSDKATIDTFVDGTTVTDFAGYDILEVWIIARTDDAAALPNPLITVNNDGSAIYDRAFEGANNTTQQASSSNAATSWNPTLHGSGGSASYPGVLRLTIPGYANTTFWKVGELTQAAPDATASNQAVSAWALGYRSTSAITRIKLDAGGSQKYKIGTRLIVYGR